MKREGSKTLEQIEKELDTFKEEGEEQVVNKRTAEKKLIVDRRDEGLYQIVYSAGGEVPDVLKGKYTTVRLAEAAITDYLSRQASG